MAVVLLYNHSYISIAEINFNSEIIIPDFLSSYTITACNSNVFIPLHIEGNSKIEGRNFSSPNFIFTSPVRSDTSIMLSGNAYVNSNAIVAAQNNVIINGNAQLTGEIITADNLLDCSIPNITELIDWVEQNHQNELIPITNQGRIPWDCSDNLTEWEFCLKQNETITIPSGTYWFTKWTQYNNSKVYANGYVRIFITGEINIKNNAYVNANPYNLIVYNISEEQVPNYEFNLSGNSKVNALLYAPYSKINL